MPFDWRTFNDVAEELSRARTDAHVRSAVSRAYYAAHNVARKLCRARGGGDRKHEHLWLFLEREQCSMGPIGVIGDQLKSQRVDADYYDQKELKDFDVQKAIMRSKAIIADVDRLLEEMRGG
jgi:uncharacterized protein (UPF0332 family)